MPSYETYVWADVGPIIAASGLIYIAYILYLVYICCKGCGRDESTAERRMVKFALGDLCTEENNGRLYIHGLTVVPAVVRTLVGYVFNIALLAFAVGWDIFLVETSYACDPGLDCFIRETSQSIQNCSAFTIIATTPLGITLEMVTIQRTVNLRLSASDLVSITY